MESLDALACLGEVAQLASTRGHAGGRKPPLPAPLRETGRGAGAGGGAALSLSAPQLGQLARLPRHEMLKLAETLYREAGGGGPGAPPTGQHLLASRSQTLPSVQRSPLSWEQVLDMLLDPRYTGAGERPQNIQQEYQGTSVLGMIFKEGMKKRRRSSTNRIDKWQFKGGRKGSNKHAVAGRKLGPGARLRQRRDHGGELAHRARWPPHPCVARPRRLRSSPCFATRARTLLTLALCASGDAQAHSPPVPPGQDGQHVPGSSILWHVLGERKRAISSASTGSVGISWGGTALGSYPQPSCSDFAVHQAGVSTSDPGRTA